MMDILFESRYVRDRDLAKEFYGYYFFRRKLVIATHIALIWCFLVGIMNFVFFHDFNWLLFLMPPLLFALRIVSYVSQVNAMVKRDREMFGEIPCMIARAGEEGLVLSVPDSENGENGENTVSKISYSMLKQAILTKNLILVRSKANLVFIFRRDSFCVGSEEDFLNFLRSKGLAVKGK